MSTDVAVVGCGRMGQHHAESLAVLAGVRVHVWDIDERAKQESAAASGASAASTFESLLADPAIAGVVIAAPNRFHAGMAIAALRAGKHVLLEKPMALGPEDAGRVVEAAEESGRILHVGFELRNSLFPIEVKKLVANGEIGPLVSAQVVEYRGHFWPEWKGRASDGGSMQLMETCHAIDLFRWWTGDEVETVHAVGTRRNIVRHYEYPDTQFNTFVFRRGFVGHVLTCHTRSAIPDPASRQSLYEPALGHQYEYSVTGENGSLHFLPLQKVCRIYRHEHRPDGAVWQRTHRVIDYGEFADHGPLIHDTSNEIRHFVEMIRGDRAPSIAPRDALQTHLVCFAARQALASGRPVTLPDRRSAATAEEARPKHS
jgi:predicted dehydrogenase